MFEIRVLSKIFESKVDEVTESFMIWLMFGYYLDDQIKDEMGWARGTCGEAEGYIQVGANLGLGRLGSCLGR